jgi:glutaredoxin 2
VCGIPRKSTPIQVIVHYPQTEEGKRVLAQRVASVHADMVNQYIQKLNCPSEQKVQLLDAVIETASQKPATKKRASVLTR